MAIVQISPNFLAMKLQGCCQLPVNIIVLPSPAPAVAGSWTHTLRA